MTNGRPKPEDASDRELLDGVKGRWGLNYQMGFEAEFLRRLAASQPGEPGTARCPECGLSIGEKEWENGDINAVCANLHVFPIKHASDFAQFFHPSAPSPQPDVFIGDLRRKLFMPYDCSWNGYVRDVTAKLEKEGGLVSEEAVNAQVYKHCALLMQTQEIMKYLGVDPSGSAGPEPIPFFDECEYCHATQEPHDTACPKYTEPDPPAVSASPERVNYERCHAAFVSDEIENLAAVQPVAADLPTCEWPNVTNCAQREACMQANRCLRNLPETSGLADQTKEEEIAKKIIADGCISETRMAYGMFPVERIAAILRPYFLVSQTPNHAERMLELLAKRVGYSNQDEGLINFIVNKLAAVAPVSGNGPEPTTSPEYVPDLYRLAYMPGVWRCPKCEFVLSKATISMSSGTIGTTPEDRQSEECPNDGTFMLPVTYKESLKQCQERLIRELERAGAASHNGQGCGQSERDARLIEAIENTEIVYYGPQECDLCGAKNIIRGSVKQGFGDIRFDWPINEPFIYPNHNWIWHQCNPLPAPPSEANVHTETPLDMVGQVLPEENCAECHTVIPRGETACYSTISKDWRHLRCVPTEEK